MYNYKLVPRGWIYFAQIAGTALSVIVLIMYIFYSQAIINSFDVSDATKYMINGIAVGVLVYFTWKSIYSAIIICNFIASHHDDEIIGNKFVLAALSLSLGGFFTPFVLTSLPNVNATSTVNPKVFISRHLSITAFVGSALALAIYFGMTIKNVDGSIFNVEPTIAQGTKWMLIVLGTIMAISFVTIVVFCRKNAYEKYDNNSFMKFISYIWLVVSTIELIIMIFLSIIRLLGAIADLFQAMSSNNNSVVKFLQILFAITRLLITFTYTIFLIRIISETISGIWAKDNVIEYNYYEALTTVKNKYAEK